MMASWRAHLGARWQRLIASKPLDLPEGFPWWRWPHVWSVGGGSGLLQPLPGTWGSLAAVPVYLLLSAMCPNRWWYGAVVLGATAVSVWTAERTSRALGVHDHRAIVCDEVVGMLVTFAGMPNTLVQLVLGFLLFRLFDILKPWPIAWVDQRVQGGWGIVLDDVVAGGMAWVVLSLLAN